MLTIDYYMHLHASTVGVVSGVPTIGTAFTIVCLPISASLGIESTISSCGWWLRWCMLAVNI